MSFEFTEVGRLPETSRAFATIVEVDTDGDIHLTAYDARKDRDIESICIDKRNITALIRALQKMERGEI